MTTQTADGGTSAADRRNWLLIAAALATGVAGSATLIVSQRHLGLEAFAPVAQLWTFWAVMAAGLTFSFQQWAAVQPVRRTDLLLGRASARVMGALGAGAVVLFVVCFSVRDDLFRTDAVVWPIAVALLPFGTALNGMRRGELAQHRRIGLLAMVIAGENLIRLAVTIGLVLVDADASWFPLALLSGFVVVVGPAGKRDPRSSLARTGVSTLGAAALAGFLAHGFMFGSPLLLNIAGGPAASVSALFLVLTAVRVPFVVLQALTPRLAVALNERVDAPAFAALVRRRTRLAAVVLGGAAACAGWLLGDLVVGTVFDIRGEVSATAYAMVSASSVLALCALIATIVLAVDGRAGRIVAAWGLPSLSAVIVTATGLVSDVNALAVWLLLVHVMVMVVAVAPVNPARSRGSQSSPDAASTYS